MKTSKILGTAFCLLIAPFIAKAAPKFDFVQSYLNRPAQEYTLLGTRFGIYDENMFFGVETQQETIGDDEQRSNFAAARLPLKISGHLLRAELMGSQEPDQSSLGIRMRYFFDDNHSLGPIVESLTTETENKTLTGLQGHIEYKGVRTEAGYYQTNSTTGVENIINGIINFTAFDNRFGFAWKVSDTEMQWYALNFLKPGKYPSYRITLSYEPTAGKTSQQLIIGKFSDGHAYYPLAPREQGDSMADIIPERPDAPTMAAGVPEWFLASTFSNKKAGLQIDHSSDEKNNAESLGIQTVVYPLGLVDKGPEPLKGLFFGTIWNQNRTGSETTTSTTWAGGYRYKNFRAIVQQQEGSKGATQGYLMYSQMW